MTTRVMPFRGSVTSREQVSVYEFGWPAMVGQNTMKEVSEMQPSACASALTGKPAKTIRVHR